MSNPDGVDMTSLLDDVSRLTEREIKVVFDACNARRRTIQSIQAGANVVSLNIGEEVRLKGLSPKYLNGAICKITKINGTKFSVDYVSGGDPRAAMKLRHATVPASCVEAV